MNEVFLRPLTVGELLDKAFRIYRSKFPTLIGIVASVLIPLVVIRLFAILYASGIAAAIDSILQSFFQLVANVALVAFISCAYLGKTIAFGGSFSLGLKRYWSVWGANLLVGLAVGVPIGLMVVCAATAMADLSWIVIILALPVVVYLSTRWSLVMPAIVLENIGATDGLKRSWSLTDQFFWRVMGTSFAARLLTMLITMLPSYFAAYLFSLSDLPYEAVQVINLFIEQVALLISLPFSQAVVVLIYYDLRVRKEGFDLEVLAGDSNTPIVAPS